MEHRRSRRLIWIALSVVLFFSSAIAAGAAVAFLPDWTAILVVIASAYGLWLLGERARQA